MGVATALEQPAYEDLPLQIESVRETRFRLCHPQIGWHCPAPDISVGIVQHQSRQNPACLSALLVPFAGPAGLVACKSGQVPIR